MDGVFAGHTALQAASQNGHLEVIAGLLRHRAHLEKEVRLWLRGTRRYSCLAEKKLLFNTTVTAITK